MKTPKFLKDLNKGSICYLESSLNYTLYYFRDGKKMISGYILKVFEQFFDNQDFVKINRSKLINADLISLTLVMGNIYSVQLVNGEEIPIARRRLNRLRELLPTMF